MFKVVKYVLQFSNEELIEIRKIFNIHDVSIKHISCIMNSKVFNKTNDISNEKIKKRIQKEFDSVPFDCTFSIDF